MKKFLFCVGAMTMPLVFMLGGCSVNKIELVKENISEITYDYFYGKCDEFEVAISSGEREEPYAYDGRKANLCEFGLAVAKLNSKKESEVLVFSVNGDATSVTFEYNIMTGTYMFDFEKMFGRDDVVSVKYGNTQITLENISKNFAVDYEKALQIGTAEFDQEISALMQKDELKAECYLKILDNLSNDFDNQYWCFSVVNEEGEHLNCIIDIESGEVVAKS